jgi:hypothetical protein
MSGGGGGVDNRNSGVCLQDEQVEITRNNQIHASSYGEGKHRVIVGGSTISAERRRPFNVRSRSVRERARIA